MTAKELRELRAALAKQIRDLADKANNEKRAFTAEEETNWTKINAEYDALTRQIEIAERAERVTSDQDKPKDDEKRQGKPGNPPHKPGRDDRDTGKAADEEDRAADDDEHDDEGGDDDEESRAVKAENFDVALQGWMLIRADRRDKVTLRHRAAAKRCGIDINRREFDIDVMRQAPRLPERRAMSAIDTTLGASTIEPVFVRNFERALLEFGGMRQVAQVIRTETGAQMSWPTSNDTMNEGVIVGENTSAGDATDPTTGETQWGAYKYTSRVIKVPVELLEDSAFDMAAIVGEMCGERIGRRQNRDFTVGDGASKPNGLIPAATLGVTAASATAITFDELFNLIHSVDPAYRNGASWMIHDNILLAVRKLKDSQNRYLWESSLQTGTVDRLIGYPYTVNQSMGSSLAASNKVAAFGQMSKYKIRDVRSLRLRRLVERYADTDQEGFVAFFRSDGNLLDAGTHPVKYLQMAAS